MPTDYWYPESIAGHNLPASCDAFVLAAGSNKNSALLDGATRSAAPTPDDATTYISCGTNGNRQATNIDWPRPMVSVGGTFNHSSRHGFTDGGGGADASTYEYTFVNAAGTKGGVIRSGGETFAYTTYGPTDVSNAATYRPGGGAWLVSDFNDTQSLFCHYTITGLVNDTWKISTVWGQIQYVAPAGGFAFLLNLAGLSALPFVGAMTDFAHFRRYLAWRERFHRRHTQWADEAEILLAWRDVRDYRFPVYAWR